MMALGPWVLLVCFAGSAHKDDCAPIASFSTFELCAERGVDEMVDRSFQELWCRHRDSLLPAINPDRTIKPGRYNLGF